MSKRTAGNTKKKQLIILAVLLAFFAVNLGVYAAVKRNDSAKDTAQLVANTSLVDKNSMDYRMYSNHKGDAYDRMFLANMIEHHKGAVDMALLAQERAKHEEIKALSKAIIETQTQEISDMEKWQKDWNYPVSSGEMMMDHSAMGMMASMDEMTESLSKLSGEDFDKAFLKSMIEHHQSGVNMSAPGASNAKHNEVKKLTVAIVNAQTKEIIQMKQWQQAWGY